MLPDFGRWRPQVPYLGDRMLVVAIPLMCRDILGNLICFYRRRLYSYLIRYNI
jgi:hypothetical protein